MKTETNLDAVRRVGYAATKNALPLLMTFVSLLAACGNNKSFDSDAWLKADMRARGRMCEDLVNRRIPIGQTAEEAQRTACSW